MQARRAPVAATGSVRSALNRAFSRSISSGGRAGTCGLRRSSPCSTSASPAVRTTSTPRSRAASAIRAATSRSGSNAALSPRHPTSVTPACSHAAPASSTALPSRLQQPSSTRCCQPASGIVRASSRITVPGSMRPRSCSRAKYVWQAPISSRWAAVSSATSAICSAPPSNASSPAPARAIPATHSTIPADASAALVHTPSSSTFFTRMRRCKLLTGLRPSP